MQSPAPLIPAVNPNIIDLSSSQKAFALAALGLLCKFLLAVTIPAQGRARINSLTTALILLISAPVGWIAGQLSEQNRMFPLTLNLLLLSAELLIVLFMTRIQNNLQDRESSSIS